MPGPCRDPGPALRGKDERVEPMRLHHFIDAVGRGQAKILPAIRFVATAIRGQVHLVSVVEIDWPYLSAPAFVWASFQVRSAVRAFTGAVKQRQPAAEVTLHAGTLYVTEHSASFPFAPSGPEQTFQLRKLFEGSASTMLGISAGSMICGPLLPHHRECVIHRRALLCSNPAARDRLKAARRDCAVEESARHTDTRALQRGGVEKSRVVETWWRGAHVARGGVVWVGERRLPSRQA